MVILPTESWEKRRRRRPRLLDSLIGVWRRTTDPDDAFDLFVDMQMWSGGGPALQRLDSVRIAAGDTAFLYETLTHQAYGRSHAVDSAEARAMIGFMDPAMVWSIGSSHGWLASDLIQGLMTSPRAAGLATPGCTVTGCAVLARQWKIGKDQTLRDVGLVALFTTDPARWADTVVALDGPAHPLLHSAGVLARGVGATWPAASKAPLPPPNGDWRAWLEWMNGGNHPSRVRFEESHEVAIRFYSAMTGRDIIGELQRGYDRATTDSTRFVFGFMLERLAKLQLSATEVADALTSGVPARVALGKVMLSAGLYTMSTRMSDSAAAPLVDRVIGAVVDGVPLWRAVDLLGTPTAASLPETHVDPRQRFVLADSIPDVVRGKWTGRANLISASGWAARDVKAAGVLYTISSMRVWGKFARVSVELSEHVGRQSDEAPVVYAAGKTYDLMLLNGEWVLIDQSGWIT